MPPFLHHALVAAIVLGLTSPAAAANPRCVDEFNDAHTAGPYRARVQVQAVRQEPSIVEATERARREQQLDLLLWVDPPDGGRPLRMHLSTATMTQRRSRALVHDAMAAGSTADARICALVASADRQVRRANVARRGFAGTAIASFLLFAVAWNRARRSGVSRGGSRRRTG